MQRRDKRHNKSYHSNLAGLHDVCETNYLRLHQLISDWDDFDALDIAIDSGHGVTQRVTLQLQERNPYTSTIMLHQQDVLLPWAEGPEIMVRVYHDARMAEVISWNRHRLLKPRYDYPNQQMYLPDEKAQLNRFLGECLGQCLRYGRIPEPVSLSGQ